MNCSGLGLVEVIAQDRVYQIGLGDLELVGSPLGKFLIVVRDDDCFVFLGKSPGA
jgi:hypothetical protein